MDGAIALLQPQSPPNELEGRDVATDIRSAFKTFFYVSRWVEHWNRIITRRLENTATQCKENFLSGTKELV